MLLQPIDVTYTAAFFAGLMAFFTPCVLPLIPAYFTFITGFSLEELTQNPTAKIKLKVIFATLFFVLGFSSIFTLMGASASYIGGMINTHRYIIRIAGGIIIILFGIHLMGIIRIRKLDFEKRLHIKKKPLHFVGAFFIGMAFGAGWSPCIGPLLGSILTLASNQETMFKGTKLLSIFSAGLALPFLTVAFFIDYLLKFIKRATKVLKYVNIGAGILLVAVGILLLTDKLNIITI